MAIQLLAGYNYILVITNMNYTLNNQNVTFLKKNKYIKLYLNIII